MQQLLLMKEFYCNAVVRRYNDTYFDHTPDAYVLRPNTEHNRHQKKPDTFTKKVLNKV